MSRRKVVVMGPQVPLALAGALEEAGLEVHHRELGKPKQMRTPFPIGSVAVVCIKSGEMEGAARRAARDAGLQFFGGGSTSGILQAMVEAGLLRPSASVRASVAPISLMMVGNIPEAERRRLDEEIAFVSNGRCAVRQWIAPGIPLGDTPFAVNGIGTISDRTPADVKADVEEWSKTSTPGNSHTPYGGELPHVRAPFRDWTGRMPALMRLLKAILATADNATDAPAARRDPPKWFDRQAARDRDREEAGKRQRAFEAEKAARDAEQRERVLDAAHADAIVANALRDDEEKRRASEEEEAWAMNERYPRKLRAVPTAPPIPTPAEAAAERAPASPAGTWIGGTELVRLEDAAGAIFTTVATLRRLAEEGKIATVAINGEPYISYPEIEKAEAAMAPLMDAASDLAVRASREDGLLYSEEAAAYLGCSIGTVTRKTNEGFITRAGKDGKAWLYRKADLDDWRDRRKSQATMRRRVGPLGIPGANHAEDPVVVDEARAAIKNHALAIQELLGTASLAAVTVGPDEITVRKIVVEEETL